MIIANARDTITHSIQTPFANSHDEQHSVDCRKQTWFVGTKQVKDESTGAGSHTEVDLGVVCFVQTNPLLATHCIIIIIMIL